MILPEWRSNNGERSKNGLLAPDNGVMLIDGSAHWLTDKGCPHCWPGWPKRCLENAGLNNGNPGNRCNGLIHGELEVDPNGMPYIRELCERCGAETVEREVWRNRQNMAEDGPSGAAEASIDAGAGVSMPENENVRERP